MSSRSKLDFFGILLVFLLALTVPSISHAEPLDAPKTASSAFDLVNAVNALRASNGLPAYSISPILMSTAQNQADFMAGNGIVTHSGPAGISLTDRLLAAGYPLSGDLSLGGFRAENITSGSESMTADAAVNQWTGDAPHLNTMLSSNLVEIGAGVAVKDGKVYYVIDAARPTTSGVPQEATPVVVDGTTVPANEAPPVSSIVIISTPNAVGDVIHEVAAGQTLWQIAVSYNVKIDNVKNLNNLIGDFIYPGQKLLIKKAQAGSTHTPTETPPPTATAFQTYTALPTSTKTKVPATATPTVIAASVPANNSMIMGVVLGIIALALLGGGVFTWLGTSKRSE
jgi:uncharacterized protein YkwD